MSISIQNPDEGLTEDDNFSTQQLFSFAWQIAKGMVITILQWITLR